MNVLSVMIATHHGVIYLSTLRAVTRSIYEVTELKISEKFENEWKWNNLARKRVRIFPAVTIESTFLYILKIKSNIELNSVMTT
jgi:hypothetical protein